ncbi:putative integral membrane protein [Brugia pahangi]
MCYITCRIFIWVYVCTVLPVIFAFLWPHITSRIILIARGVISNIFELLFYDIGSCSTVSNSKINHHFLMLALDMLLSFAYLRFFFTKFTFRLLLLCF